jgi:hypothetical protein
MQTLKHSLILSICLLGSVSAQAADKACQSLPSQAELKQALTAARQAANGGLNLDMRGTGKTEQERPDHLRRRGGQERGFPRSDRWY